MANKYKKVIKKPEGSKMVCQNKDCEYMGKHLNPDDFYKTRNSMMPYHPFVKSVLIR